MTCHLQFKDTCIDLDFDDYSTSALRLVYDEENDSWGLPDDWESFSLESAEDHHPFRDLIRLGCKELNEKCGVQPRALITIVLDDEAAQFLSETVEIYKYRCDAQYELQKLSGHIQEYPNGLPLELWCFPVAIGG